VPADLRAAAGRRRARIAAGDGRALILYYHRIAAPAADPWRTSVSPRAFAVQLEFLASEMRVLPLPELVDAARHGRLPERAVAISFDDGYLDNLAQGLPLLERHQLPATFYVASGYLDTPGPYWWDELADLLLGAGPRPAKLDMVLGGTRVSLPTATEEQRRIALFGKVDAALKRLPAARIDAALEPLRAWAGRGGASAALSDDGLTPARPMTAEEVARLAASELTTIGAHTSLHSDLAEIAGDEQRWEMRSNREQLAEIVGAPPSSLAYPYGRSSRRTRQIARELGFDNAVGTREDMPVTAAGPRFELPRMVVYEESPSALEARMRRVLQFGGRSS
jgi:peptidoglycan/xylan/chitin deacetylase (PgdA/CDA1 family)